MLSKNISNKEPAWLFGNRFPNILDTTVDNEITHNRPDTYIITGDIVPCGSGIIPPRYGPT